MDIGIAESIFIIMLIIVAGIPIVLDNRMLAEINKSHIEYDGSLVNMNTQLRERLDKHIQDEYDKGYKAGVRNAKSVLLNPALFEKETLDKIEDKLNRI